MAPARGTSSTTASGCTAAPRSPRRASAEFKEDRPYRLAYNNARLTPQRQAPRRGRTGARRRLQELTRPWPRSPTCGRWRAVAFVARRGAAARLRAKRAPCGRALAA
jgi:hypothetical protein